MIGEHRRDVGLLSATLAFRTNACWTASPQACERGLASAPSHIERPTAAVPPHCEIVMMTDAHPASLGWLGSVLEHPALGVEHFGQTGTIANLNAHYGIDAIAIFRAAETVSPGRQLAYLRVVQARLTMTTESQTACRMFSGCARAEPGCALRSLSVRLDLTFNRHHCGHVR